MGGTLGVAVVSRWRRWPAGRAEAFTGVGIVSFRGARVAPGGGGAAGPPPRGRAVAVGGKAVSCGGAGGGGGGGGVGVGGMACQGRRRGRLRWGFGVEKAGADAGLWGGWGFAAVAPEVWGAPLGSVGELGLGREVGRVPVCREWRVRWDLKAKVASERRGGLGVHFLCDLAGKSWGR